MAATGREVRLWPLPPMVLYYEIRAGALLVVRLWHGARRPITR
jgi:hypothetical protein